LYTRIGVRYLHSVFKKKKKCDIIWIWDTCWYFVFSWYNMLRDINNSAAALNYKIALWLKRDRWRWRRYMIIMHIISSQTEVTKLNAAAAVVGNATHDMIARQSYTVLKPLKYNMVRKIISICPQVPFGGNVTNKSCSRRVWKWRTPEVFRRGNKFIPRGL